MIEQFSCRALLCNVVITNISYARMLREVQRIHLRPTGSNSPDASLQSSNFSWRAERCI